MSYHKSQIICLFLHQNQDKSLSVSNAIGNYNMKKISWIALAFLLGFMQSIAAEKVIVAYVTSWSQTIPDPTVMTHINYAFGHVDETFDGVRIDQPDRLRQIVA